MKTKKTFDKGIVGLSAYLLISAVILTLCNLPSFNQYNALLFDDESGSSFYSNTPTTHIYMDNNQLALNGHGDQATAQSSFFYGW